MPRHDMKSIFVSPLLFCLLLFLSGPLLAAEWWEIEVDSQRIRVEIARSESEQTMGLGNRFSLPEGEGMLFVYSRPGRRGFWMKRMHFPIDIIWFRGNRAVHIEKRVPPPVKGTPDKELKVYGRHVSADRVLEVPAGFCRRNGISIGSRLKIISGEF